ncbi:NAD(P)-dependent oxidoreductase [Nonomuraea typhae]|uniref:NAD(P)-dependent oxidoreductase n=1 Tax=Nonomuraea typhae TaxID=2603600 RepID=UPI0012F9127D|nr:NAD(P)-binding domain-containing protein [Nonomuraea typhae]
MNVAFVGLGIMGLPMATNLTKAGYVVTAYDVSPARMESFDGKTATGAGAAVAEADLVVTMLPDSPQVEEVAPEIAAHGRPGLLWADMSTIRPETARWAAGLGVRTLDAPVSGGERGAIDGTLSIMAGGAEADFAAALPVFRVLGKTIVHVGPAGAGQTVKAANQLVVGGIYGLVAEAIVLLEASGVDPGKGLDVLAGGLAGSRVLDLKRTSMIVREFVPGFRIDLHHKDMGIALAAAREAGVALPLTGQVAQLVAAARAQGHGSLDHSALLKVIERLNS